MHRDIFGEFVNPPIRTGGKSLMAVATMMVVESLAIVALIVVPLMIVGVVPRPPSIIAFVDRPDPPSPPAIAPRHDRPIVETSKAAPTEPPNEIRAEPEVGGGFEREVPQDSTIVGTTDGVLEPPPAPRKDPPPDVPLRVGGTITQPQKTKDVRPVYPPMAQAAGVQGFVIIEAVIAPDGSIRDAKVLRSLPLCDQAALEAVRQWQFTPTLLNGQPVPVIMTVTVQFTLRR
jgi:protein TonB